MEIVKAKQMKNEIENSKDKGNIQKFLLYMKKNGTCYLFLLPLILSVLLFAVYPMVSSFIYSFSDYTLYAPWISELSFDNYIKMFTSDWVHFGNALRITGIYTIISVPLMMVLSFLLALFLNHKLSGVKIFRTLYYVPMVIPAVVSALLWKNILDPSFGIANRIFEMLGLPKSDFVFGSKDALTSLIVLGLWGVGGTMILWLSALKNVPESLIESAKLDGAGSLRRLLVIILPMCSPIIFYNLIMAIITALQNFGSFAMVGGGGTDDSLMFIAVKIYIDAFAGYDLAYACAMGWFLFLIIALLTVVIFRSSKWVFYGEES